MGILEKPMGGFSFLKGEDLKAGVTVKLVKAEAITLDEEKAKFAVKADSKLVKEGILKAGQTMRYLFLKTDELLGDWEEVAMENSSTGFYMSLSNINPDADTIFTIKRTGEGTATKYAMAVVEDEKSS
jgi:hypothetical protein